MPGCARVGSPSAVQPLPTYDTFGDASGFLSQIDQADGLWYKKRGIFSARSGEGEA
jgi:hypothetical protein